MFNNSNHKDQAIILAGWRVLYNGDSFINSIKHRLKFNPLLYEENQNISLYLKELNIPLPFGFHVERVSNEVGEYEMTIEGYFKHLENKPRIKLGVKELFASTKKIHFLEIENRLCQRAEFLPYTPSNEYMEKWNISPNSTFFKIGRNGIPISNDFYKVTSLNDKEFGGNKYIRISKCIEHIYPLSKIQYLYPYKIREQQEKQRYCINTVYCIIRNDGKEMKVFDKDSSVTPYLVKNSLIYSIGVRYFNVETGEMYCESYSSMDTKDFLFLHNKHGEDKSLRGVMKINKEDGTFELFKEEEENSF